MSCKTHPSFKSSNETNQSAPHVIESVLLPGESRLGRAERNEQNLATSGLLRPGARRKHHRHPWSLERTPHDAEMPPRLNILVSCRALALRPRRPAAPPPWQAPRALPLPRSYSNDAPTVPPTQPAAPPPAGPPPSSAAAPLSGAPPSDAPGPSKAAPTIPSEDFDVALSSLKAGRAVVEQEVDEGDIMANEEALRQLERISYGVESFDSAEVGHKYGVPEVPIPSGMHLKHRYHPVLEQITNLLMKDGKKSKAQRVRNTHFNMFSSDELSLGILAQAGRTVY